MPRGGYRPGSGRPKGTTGIPQKQTIEKEAARAALRQIVLENMRSMVDAQIKHAIGIKYLVVRGKKGGRFEKVTSEMIEGGILDSDNHIIEMWEKEPSVQAFTDLMNRAIDKPAEQALEVNMNVSGDLTARLLAGRKRVAEAKR